MRQGAETAVMTAARETVLLQFERHHKFEGRRAKSARCVVCGRGQHWIEHLGFPEPLDTDSGTHPRRWQSQKRMWQEAFGEALHASGLPRGLETVQVAVRYVFGSRVRRDRDNLVYPLCKFLGDTLVRGRYVEVPYAAVDWSDAGMVDGRKLMRRLVDPTFADEFGGCVRLVGRDAEPDDKENAAPAAVYDPLGGWIEDDRWDRFDVIDMQAAYAKGREALEVMVMPGTEPPPEWPPKLPL